MNAEGKKIPSVEEVKFAPADKWIISRLQNCIREVTTNLGKYELGMASELATDFVWDDFLRGGRGAETFGAVGALFRIGERVEAAAPVYSVRDGGDLSEPAGDGGEHHGFFVPAV